MKIVTKYGDIGNLYGFVDEFGNVVERNMFTHPYSYDGFVIYRGGENSEAKDTVYTDRLRSECSFEELSKKYDIRDMNWRDKSIETLEMFLSELFSKKMKIILFMQYCNISTGYPVWRIDYTF